MVCERVKDVFGCRVLLRLLLDSSSRLERTRHLSSCSDGVQESGGGRWVPKERNQGLGGKQVWMHPMLVSRNSRGCMNTPKSYSSSSSRSSNSSISSISRSSSRSRRPWLYTGTKHWNGSSHFFRDLSSGSSAKKTEEVNSPGKEAPVSFDLTDEAAKKSHGAKSEFEKRHEWLTLPNAITMGRMAATPYLSYLILHGHYDIALAGLGVAAGSDWLDGYIAKRYKQQSIVGSFLDPLADKMMMTVISISLSVQGLIPAEIVALILARDFVLIGGTFYHRYKTKTTGSAFFSTQDPFSFEVEPSVISKINTALQFSMLGLALTNHLWSYPGDLALNVLFGSIFLTTISSGVGYVSQYYGREKAFQGVFQQSKKKSN